MYCSFIENGEPCGSDTATVYLDFAVCEEHYEVVYNRNKRFNRRTAVQAAQYHPASAFPGICYVVLLPDATVKIGYSNTEELFKRRMVDLKRKHDGHPVVLAKLPGGFVTEAVLHEKFDDHRISRDGERFRYSAEMAAYLAAM